MRKVTVSRMRDRYAQTVLTFRITYLVTVSPAQTGLIIRCLFIVQYFWTYSPRTLTNRKKNTKREKIIWEEFARHFGEIRKVIMDLLSFHRAFYTLFNYTHERMHTHTYYLRSPKFTLKHFKRSYMYRSHDHPQGTYIVPC